MKALRNLVMTTFLMLATITVSSPPTLQAVDCTDFMSYCSLFTHAWPMYYFGCDYGQISCAEINSCIRDACGNGFSFCDPGDPELEVGPSGYGTCSAG